MSGGFSSGYSSGYQGGGSGGSGGGGGGGGGSGGGYSIGFNCGFAGGICLPGVPPGDGRQFRFLQDAYVNGQYISAGQIASDADLLPARWGPTGDVEPLNQAAINAFFAAGVQLPGLIRTQYAATIIKPPVVYWKLVSVIGGIYYYQLTGGGSGLGTVAGPPPGTFN